MSRSKGTVFVVMVAAVVSGCASPRTDRAAQPCGTGEVHVLGLGQVSAMTGEQAFEVYIGATGEATCTLSGYPSVSLEADGVTVPFTYKRGGGQYLDASPPRTVTLKPGPHPSASFEVAKYRCDLGELDHSTVAAVRLPGSTTVTTIDLAEVASLDWCKPVRLSPDTPGSNEADYRDGMTVYVEPLRQVVGAVDYLPIPD